eukprot:TRINITY_DN11844_c0_g4_i2.p1 TRINITY_DN11844_c0_g4~~TRINITY_DN11844_c0_g4_i2.p1  ORF type:complete len:303 (+),score=74.61 TRINITY_DN11844_c0_g4_i2:80-988(+)
MQDRTNEFRACVQSFGSGGAAMRSNRSDKPKSKLFITARNIDSSLADTYKKLERLETLQAKSNPFGPRTNVQELTGVIKEDMSHLTRAIGKLQEHIKSENSRSSPHVRKHRASIITSLQNRLKGATAKFKQLLETRTENLKSSRQRRSQFSGRGLTGSVPDASAMPTLMMTSQLEQQQQQQQSTMGAAPGGDVAIDLGQMQEMELYEQEDTYVSQRAETMQSIESTIAELGQVFQQLAETIQQQGEKIERIDENIAQVDMNVEAAHNELLTYYQSISSNRMLMFKIFGVLLVFFILFVVVLA